MAGAAYMPPFFKKRKEGGCMDWQSTAALITFIGFLITVIKAVIPLTNAITLLTQKVEVLNENFQELEEKKAKAHERIWEHNRIQDKWLEEHEMRLHDLDGKSRGKLG